MDIRTRLIFALVTISLLSMAALGTFAYGTVQDLLRETSLHKLEAVAASKAQDLERVYVAWSDRVRLLTSRTQLRMSLAALDSGEDREDNSERVERILEDALQSTGSLEGIEVFDIDGRPVARVGRAPEVVMWAAPELASDDEPRMYRDVIGTNEAEHLVSFIAPLRLEGRRIGTALVHLSTEDLRQVTADYTGLGDTGETLITRLDPESGGALVLTPTRHDVDHFEHLRIDAEQRDVPAFRAARGDETAVVNAIDFSGESVYAATRWLPHVGWGVVVKVDSREEEGAIIALRSMLLKLALSLSAFGIVAGTVIGFFFARPIHELAEVAQRVGAGEWDLRAEEAHEDELGQLAVSFNRMTEQLVAANRELEKKLGSREDPRGG